MSFTRRQLLRYTTGALGAAGLQGCVTAPETRPGSAASAMQVPLVGQGTYTLGERAADHDTELAALRLGIDLGLTHIDTAELYGDGGAEALIGEAVLGRRRDVFITSKVSPDHASYEGTLRAAEGSLRRLRTDYLDLYLLHWEPTRFALAETMHALERLWERGLVRAIGVSNFETGEQLARAQAALRRARLHCNQMKYSLSDRHIERTLLPYCRAHGIAVTGYMPFDRFPAAGSAGRVALDEVAARRGCSAHQAALAFLFRQGVFQIPRAGNVEHARDNAGALRVSLDAEDVARLEGAFPLDGAANNERTAASSMGGT